MKQSVFIDTDILLDFFLDRKPFVNYAAEIFSLAEQKQIKALVSPISFCNAYYFLRKIGNHTRAIQSLNKLLSFVEITKMNKLIIEQALQSGFNDFEDAVQNYSAFQHDRIDALLTRNIKDYKKSSLAIMTPETFLKSYIP